jgi:hypothetical protein
METVGKNGNRRFLLERIATDKNGEERIWAERIHSYRFLSARIRSGRNRLFLFVIPALGLYARVVRMENNGEKTETDGSCLNG